MKLHPDNEELSLLAAIALFTPTRNGISDRDDMFYLESIQVFGVQSSTVYHVIKRVMVKTLKKKLNRDPLRMQLLADFLMGIGKFSCYPIIATRFV